MGGLDLSLLGKSFADPSTLKILHAGDNDIRILKRDYGMEFRNVFDTHRAADLLGCHYLALAALIVQCLGIEFVKNKKIQRSRWDARPLSVEQMTYAVQDTAYLVDLYLALEKEIAHRGLQARAAEIFHGVTMVEWRERTLDPRGHEKIKGWETLSPRERSRLRGLYQWRFAKSKAIDRAPFMVLADNEMVNLARVRTVSSQDLLEEGCLSQDKGNAFGEEIMRVLNRAAS